MDRIINNPLGMVLGFLVALLGWQLNNVYGDIARLKEKYSMQQVEIKVIQATYVKRAESSIENASTQAKLTRNQEEIKGLRKSVDTIGIELLDHLTGEENE